MFSVKRYASKHFALYRQLSEKSRRELILVVDDQLAFYVQLTLVSVSVSVTTRFMI